MGESGVDDVSEQDHRTPDNVWGIIQSGKKGAAVNGKETNYPYYWSWLFYYLPTSVYLAEVQIPWVVERRLGGTVD